MKIYVKSKKTRRYCIPVPLSIVTLILKPVSSTFIKRKIMEKTDKKSRVYLEEFDFKKLIGSLNQLNEYKGLKLVEVNDKEGNEVTIIV
jgi:hypothetical protein